MSKRPELAFATPRKLPKPSAVKGRVVVLDVAFASEASGGGFGKITKPFIDGLGPRLVAWVDHHDHALHADYKQDPRFVLATKAEHGARHSWGFTFQDFHEPIQIKQSSLAAVQGNCLRCHEQVVRDIVRHSDVERDANNCVRCHSSVGHGAN